MDVKSPAATSFIPSDEHAIASQSRDPALSLSSHVIPLSEEVVIYPPLGAAASLVPSAEEATPFQFL
jgi:hypothetical protein